MRETNRELRRQLDEEKIKSASLERQLAKALAKLTDMNVIDNIPHTRYLIASGKMEL
jgi:hypothetical protein